jgi:hypothetical protein
MGLAGVAAQAAGHKVGSNSQAALCLWLYMIQGCVTLAQHLPAVRAAVAPAQKDLVTEAEFILLLWDQMGVVDLMIHAHPPAMRTFQPPDPLSDQWKAKTRLCARRCPPAMLRDLTQT